MLKSKGKKQTQGHSKTDHLGGAAKSEKKLRMRASSWQL